MLQSGRVSPSTWQRQWCNWPKMKTFRSFVKSIVNKNREWMDWWVNHMPHLYQGGREPESLRNHKSKCLYSCSSWKYVLLFCVGELVSLVSSWILQQVRSDIWPYTGSIWSAHLQEQASLSLLLSTWVTIMHLQSILILIAKAVFATMFPTIFFIFYSKLSPNILFYWRSLSYSNFLLNVLQHLL